MSVFTLYNRCLLGFAVAFPVRCKRGVRNRRSLSHNGGRRRCQQSSAGWWCRSAPSRCCCRRCRPSWAWLMYWVTARWRAEASVCDGVVDTSAGGIPAWWWWWWQWHWLRRCRQTGRPLSRWRMMIYFHLPSLHLDELHLWGKNNMELAKKQWETTIKDCSHR